MAIYHTSKSNWPKVVIILSRLLQLLTDMFIVLTRVPLFRDDSWLSYVRLVQLVLLVRYKVTAFDGVREATHVRRHCYRNWSTQRQEAYKHSQST